MVIIVVGRAVYQRIRISSLAFRISFKAIICLIVTLLLLLLSFFLLLSLLFLPIDSPSILLILFNLWQYLAFIIILKLLAISQELVLWDLLSHLIPAATKSLTISFAEDACTIHGTLNIFPSIAKEILRFR